MRYPKLTRRTTIPAALVVAIVVCAGAYLLQQQRAPSAADRAARTSAAQFLDDWTEADGRVVRRDQGGDTVSEGQAYGLLLALVAHDRTRFDTIWKWTKMHMQQANGLLAWRWTDGHLADEQPAADADVDTAWALSRAAQTFGGNSYRDEATHMAQAIMQNETSLTPAGPVLVAGPWARTSPATINPSYLVSGMATILAKLTGDETWSRGALATHELDRTLVTGSSLPPDWAALPTDSSPQGVSAAGAPDGSAGPRYGLDASRLFIRLAASCDSGDRDLAADAAPIIGGTSEPAIRSLSGQGQVSWQHPISDVASAAVDSARGDQSGLDASLAAADSLQSRYPTYYGAAWAALGRALLTTDLLGTCARTAS